MASIFHFPWKTKKTPSTTRRAQNRTRYKHETATLAHSVQRCLVYSNRPALLHCRYHRRQGPTIRGHSCIHPRWLPCVCSAQPVSNDAFDYTRPVVIAALYCRSCSQRNAAFILDTTGQSVLKKDSTPILPWPHLTRSLRNVCVTVCGHTPFHWAVSYEYGNWIFQVWILFPPPYIIAPLENQKLVPAVTKHKK